MASVRLLRTARTRAVPHGVCCEYPKYPTGGTASVRGTQSALAYYRVPLAGADASLRRVCMQVKYYGGLVCILEDVITNTTGHVSVVGSTLTNITVRAHCLRTC